jgi:hypothetical protein
VPARKNRAPDLTPSESDLARAEEMVDRAGEAVGTWMARLNREILKSAARAREELEDIWAEAQSLRKS